MGKPPRARPPQVSSAVAAQSVRWIAKLCRLTRLSRNLVACLLAGEEHQPKAHQRYAQHDAATVFAWAEIAGGAGAQFLQRHVEHHRRPALSLQAGRGLQRLSGDYGMERLQAACQRALQMHARAVSSVASILRRHLDQAPLSAPLPETPLPTHDHVRGADYYTQ